MYAHTEVSTHVSTYNSNNPVNSSCKDTLHISPHIAAHKSSTAAVSHQPTLPTSTYVSLGSLPPNSSFITHDLSNYKIITQTGVASPPLENPNVPIKSNSQPYGNGRKDGIIATNIAPGTIIASGMRPSPILTNLSRVVPEDLSTSDSNKISSAAEISSQNGNNAQKPLPHIYTVAGQVSSAMFPNIIERSGNPVTTYFRSAESPNVNGQPQAILLSNVVACADGVMDGSSTSQYGSPSLMGEVVGIVETRIKKEQDGTRDSRIQQPQQKGEIMRQALQVAVGSPMPGQKNEEVIEYSYTATDIADLLMMNIAGGLPQTVRHVTGSSHSQLTNTAVGGSAITSTAQMASFNVVDASVTPVIMMPSSAGPHLSAELLSTQQQIQTVASLPTTNSQIISSGNLSSLITSQTLGPDNALPVSTSNCSVLSIAPSSGESQIVLEHPGSQKSQKRSKSNKLSEEEQMQRRMRLAQLMREKRANESEEQKAKRRIREAERMRRRRSLENEEQKARRRIEAADRARLRRATMSLEQRILDRRKAAERMRLRRQNEGEYQKAQRRKRAAERMRRRRAEESPEERALRRQNLAMRMKSRRRKKSDPLDNISVSQSPMLPESLSDMRTLTSITSLDDMEVAQDLSSSFSNSPIICGNGKASVIGSANLPKGHLLLQNSSSHLSNGIFADEGISADAAGDLMAPSKEGGNYGVITTASLLMSDEGIKRLNSKQCFSRESPEYPHSQSYSPSPRHAVYVQSVTNSPVISSHTAQRTGSVLQGWNKSSPPPPYKLETSKVITCSKASQNPSSVASPRIVTSVDGKMTSSDVITSHCLVSGGNNPGGNSSRYSHSGGSIITNNSLPLMENIKSSIITDGSHPMVYDGVPSSEGTAQTIQMSAVQQIDSINKSNLNNSVVTSGGPTTIILNRESLSYVNM